MALQVLTYIYISVCIFFFIVLGMVLVFQQKINYQCAINNRVPYFTIQFKKLIPVIIMGVVPLIHFGSVSKIVSVYFIDMINFGKDKMFYNVFSSVEKNIYKYCKKLFDTHTYIKLNY